MWNRHTFQTYYQGIDGIVTALLDQEVPEDLLTVDFDEYLDYLVSRCEWQPLEWYEMEKTIEPFTTTIKRLDRYNRTHRVDLQKFRLRIPVAPHPQRDDYLKFLPSVFTLREEAEWQFEADNLVLEVDATQDAVERALEEVRTAFGRRNADIEEGNKTLRERIRLVWQQRRNRLEEQHKAANEELEKLKIPLYRAGDAKAKPIEIKPRPIRPVLEKPRLNGKAEPYLQRADAVQLVEFIEQYARQFEIAPKTYHKMEEEELRDLIVGMMNANYTGAVTAETFSKLGKTDIALRVDAGNVLICECKFWKGSKLYGDAVDQLFRYLTWRQSYGVLIAFCTRKDMSAAIGQARKTVELHASCIARTTVVSSDSKFSTRHSHPQDSAKSVEIFHLFIDLSF